jgi:hypothetical protein
MELLGPVVTALAYVLMFALLVVLLCVAAGAF